MRRRVRVGGRGMEMPLSVPAVEMIAMKGV
jgi:hypothetical protein